MRISKKAEYALRALALLAARSKSSPMQIQELADAGEIPLKFLEQILLVLKRAGFLRSKRGIGGGYQLNRSPSQITLEEVIRVVEGQLTICGSPDSPVNVTGAIGLSQCLRDLEEMIVTYLKEQTIESLLRREEPDGVLAFDI